MLVPRDRVARKTTLTPHIDYACNCPNNCSHKSGSSCKYYSGPSSDSTVISGSKDLATTFFKILELVTDHDHRMRVPGFLFELHWLLDCICSRQNLCMTGLADQASFQDCFDVPNCCHSFQNDLFSLRSVATRL